ncbi:MAG: tRNA threonylcarbamoyladenosine dehydratase [Clostridia bacterium]|nr:tRNA threonylcarbamoyladenosine dehydratase [Clostridia bacterium]
MWEDDIYSRTELILGSEGIEKLRRARVIVFGVGGVGGYVCEVLARSGVGTIGLVDADKVSPSNINRQIIALHSTVGRLKTSVMAERISDISPDTVVREYPVFYLPDNRGGIDLSQYDVIVDAIDTVSAKLFLAEEAQRLGITIISSMGTGNKLDPTRFKICDISKTSVCPLARVMRIEARKRGIKKLTVLFSDEEPIKTGVKDETSGKEVPASVAFVPSVAGLMIGGWVVRELSGK